MKVGVPAEVRDHEYRVAITPAGVHELVLNGHEVSVQAGAGVGSGISDSEYRAAGACERGDHRGRYAGGGLPARPQRGPVLVDLSIDRGGCFEDSRPTTHAEPTYGYMTRCSAA